MNHISIVFLVILITTIPFIYYNYKEIKATGTQAIIYGILSLAISFLIIKLTKTRTYILELFITEFICTVFNYFITTKDIVIKKIPKTSAVISLFFFASISQLFIVYFLGYDLNNLSPSEDLILTTFSDTLLIITLIILYFKELKEDFKNLKGNFYKFVDTGVKYWLIGLLVMMVSNIMIGLFTNAKAVNEEGVQEIIHASKYLSIIAIGIIGPIIEELVFRKSFRDIFKNDLAFILTSGLVFGSLHVILSFNSLWDFLYIIPYSSLGIAFAAIYAKTKNIFISIFIHIFHNTILTILSIVGLGVILW